MDDDSRGWDMALVGIAIYGFASGVVTAVVVLDYIANIRVYTSSYLLGAPPFILLNLVAMVFFTRAVVRDEIRWYTLVLPLVSHVLISWLFHGLNPLWRTVILSVMVIVGILLVWISWRSDIDRSGDT